jgi:hypothetical protein
LQKHRLGSQQSKLGRLVAVESLSPYELLRLYWRAKNRGDAEVAELLSLAEDVLNIHAPQDGALLAEPDGSDAP